MFIKAILYTEIEMRDWDFCIWAQMSVWTFIFGKSYHDIYVWLGSAAWCLARNTTEREGLICDKKVEAQIQTCSVPNVVWTIHSKPLKAVAISQIWIYSWSLNTSLWQNCTRRCHKERLQLFAETLQITYAHVFLKKQPLAVVRLITVLSQQQRWK